MTEQQLYDVTCAWCKVKVGESVTPQSHGICDDCAKTLGIDNLAQERSKVDNLLRNDKEENGHA